LGGRFLRLFCLLGAIFVFAPRPLFAHHGGVSLEDQQLAGLLMIVACPLTYVVAGTVIAARWVLALEGDRPGSYVEAGAR
jgi:putative membrane protein